TGRARRRGGPLDRPADRAETGPGPGGRSEGGMGEQKAVGVGGEPARRRRARPERLSAEDARILRLERGPIAGHTCKVLVVGGPELTIEELRAGVAGRLGAAPRLRQRLSLTPLGLAPPI